jgi:amino acid transporter
MPPEKSTKKIQATGAQIAAAAVQAAHDGAKEEAVAAVMQAASPQTFAAAMQADPDKAGGVATAIAQAVPNKAGDIAAAAMQAIPTGATEEKKDIAIKAAQGLPPQEREDLCNELRPTQGTADQIWLIIVGAFAIVFVLSALALFWTAFLAQDGAQILLTVVTTIAGLLAGFISGRSSTGGSPR